MMKSFTQKEVENNVFKIFDLVKNGKNILIKSDRDQENLAVIIPYKKYKSKGYRQLGILEGKASYKIAKDFETSDEEILDL
ncbi:MAG: hypothetical protein U5R06_15000 [candidate division KSB1 bacterium]|nr:hypothetical protein [candidate division KSB1 bacterium]